MSLRTVKTFLKRTNAADKKARETIDNRNLDALDLGIPSEQSMLHEYALADLAYARWCYTKMKRAFKSLTKRQQRKLIAKTNAKQDIRNTLDKVMQYHLLKGL